jgi:hypothetical protein
MSPGPLFACPPNRAIIFDEDFHLAEAKQSVPQIIRATLNSMGHFLSKKAAFLVLFYLFFDTDHIIRLVA